MSRWFAALLLLAAAMLSGPASAQSGNDSVEGVGRNLVELFNGRGKPDQLFTAEFLAQVPAAQVEAIAASLRDQLGAARSAEIVERQGLLAGSVRVRFERGSALMRVALEPELPNRLRGLLITGTERSDDSLAAIAAELRAFPGSTALTVTRLGDAAPVPIAANEPDRRLAIGSAFKLFVLAELSRQVRAGERRWSDVVPLAHKSLPSGFLQDWPEAAPMTLHSLAALMISQSDNSATDTLLHLAGRERIETLLPTLGVSPQRNRPFLSTREAFLLKGGDPAVTARWLAADEAGRRRLLPDLAAADLAKVDVPRLNTRPNHIDKVEWFASPAELVRALDWLRRNGGKEVLDILAINPGPAGRTPSTLDYVGYKGGSETGVVAMTFLARSKSGQWFAVAGAWNNPAGPVQEAPFALLVSRAVTLLGRQNAS